MTFICHFPLFDEVPNSDFCFILQLVPVSNRTKYIPERKGSLANYDLVFQVSLPALGYSTYFIKMSTSKPFVVHLFYIEPIFYIESLFYIEYFRNFLFLLVIEKVIFKAKTARSGYYVHEKYIPLYATWASQEYTFFLTQTVGTR